MSTEREAVLIYGWTGNRESIGSILIPFAHKYIIEDIETHELGYEISESYSHIFGSAIKKAKKETGYDFELVEGNSDSEDGYYYFGIRAEYVSDQSFQELVNLMKGMSSIIDETFKGIVFDTEPSYSTVISWY